MEQNKEPRYINPLTDYGFKRIFGDSEVMTAFLTDLLEPESAIVEIFSSIKKCRRQLSMNVV